MNAKQHYDPKMFLLSVASCAGAECSGRNINQCVADAINSALDTEGWNLEDWEIVWGPAVSVIPGPAADDTGGYPSDVLFVARNRSVYFVSVAATNYLSPFDVGEDFKVQTMRHWPYAAEGPTSAGKISRGFHESLRVLQTMKPKAGLLGEGSTLRDFLSNEVKSRHGNVQVITGGHSQGGATAPLLALWLLETQSEWDREQKASISCYRSAGPTPGDEDFALYYNRRLPATTSLVNPLDFVPKMFVERELLTIPRIYEPLIHPTREFIGLVGEMVALAASGHYTQIGEGLGQLVELDRARVNMSIYEGSSPTDCQKFARQMGYQHAQAYFELLGLPADIRVGQFDGLCDS